MTRFCLSLFMPLSVPLSVHFSIRIYFRIVLAIIMLISGSGAFAQPKLVPDVSQRQIFIESSFTGEQLLLFGAIIDRSRQSSDNPIDVAVVLRGPTEPIILREKKKVAGIWINADSSTFQSAPGYYAIASSRPISEIVDIKTAAIYELGVDRLQLSPTGAIDSQELRRFVGGLTDLRQRQGLFRDNPNGVKITDNILYQARLEIPSSVPVGNYIAETLLIQDGKVIAADDNVEVIIKKIGFEAFITTLAEEYSFLYGLIAVIISILFGLAAGYIFSRF